MALRPHYSIADVILDLPAAVSRDDLEAVDTGLPIKKVKYILLDIADDLISYDEEAGITPPTNDPHPFISVNFLSERLDNGKIGPKPLPALEALVNNTNEPAPEFPAQLGNRITLKTPENRPLEDFEDLYYSILARVKTLHQDISIRLNNGFCFLYDRVWQDGPTFEDFEVELDEMWTTLNDPALVKTLDDACRRNRAKALHQLITIQRDNGTITEKFAADLMRGLYGACYNEVPGLKWIGGWSPAMISALLGEKYRLLLAREAEEEKKEQEREKARQDFEVWSDIVQEYHGWLKEVARKTMMTECKVEGIRTVEVEFVDAY
ncbi:hypothetical protein BDV96DRAFT_651671 [Lophiotrema nucula]|uniref:Uncharacterized protein n=1 Tax=Lophiotrema nucula TaxID=690887 RepID=A0A6A5YRG5_9PLEO|nr:hypothetical protein BDV96DRAFT_651671 [Lophiotrema nucula]